jgi:colanic acid biosynthesis glycosyl transferase WcaI
MRIVVLCPHFAPDVAPTGEVMTRLVDELAARGHRVEVVTALPWYRDHAVDPDWRGRLVRRETTPWGSVTRVHPFASRDKRNLLARAAGFVAFTVVATAVAGVGRRADVVMAMSPPLTLGPAGWLAGIVRRAPLVFNVQDVYPDVAVDVGALTDARVIRMARWLERFSYRRAAAVTVLSDDLADNIAERAGGRDRVAVIPNFVDATAIRPGPHSNGYRAEYGLGDRTVVMYAGNVGYSQPLGMVVEAARRLAGRDDLVFVVNGGGSGLEALEQAAAGLPNVVFAPLQPRERLAEVLAAADVHLVVLRAGVARSSVPSKTYSILAAGRPVLASIDPGSEVARMIERAGAGLTVPPGDLDSFTQAVVTLADDPRERAEMGARARRMVEGSHSPAAVARLYEDLFRRVGRS